jgi:hypothetical protein
MNKTSQVNNENFTYVELGKEEYNKLKLLMSKRGVIWLDEDRNLKIRDRFTKYDKETGTWVPDVEAQKADERQTLINQAQTELNDWEKNGNGYLYKEPTELQQPTVTDYISSLKNIVSGIDIISTELPKKPDFMNQLQEPQECIVAFIDLLGFKKIVQQSSNHNTILKLLHSFKSMSEYSLKTDASKEGDTKSPFLHPMITVFSDNIVISYPIEVGTYDSILHDLLNRILQIAQQALENDFLIRGGVAKGFLYHKNGVAFGDALVKAYELESEHAIYPRVLISQEIISDYEKSSEFQRRLELLDKGNSQLIQKRLKEELYTIDTDGQYVLNYIYYLVLFSRMSDSTKFHLYNGKIITNIESFLKKKKLKELSKWQWIKYYFDKSYEISKIFWPNAY